jgi:hypothetical protein
VTEHLERCALLSETAAWVGQDNTDLVGPDSRSPDGYQDVHIRLCGLNPDQAVTQVYVQRYSGGAWIASGSASDNAALVRGAGPGGTWSTTADLYLEPYFNDPAGFLYEVIRIQYADGTTAVINDLRSTTPVDADLRTEGQELTVTYLGQDGPDLAGSGATVGADGIKDIHLHLSHLLDYTRATDGSTVTLNPTTDTIVVSMPTTDGGTIDWYSGPPPSDLPAGANLAEVVPVQGDPTSADVYLNPVAGIAAGGTVTVQVAYPEIGKSDVSPKPSDPSAPAGATVSVAPDPTLPADPPRPHSGSR